MRADICILLSSIIGQGGACVLPSVPKSLAVYLSRLVLKSVYLWIQVSGDAGHQNAIDSPPWPAWFGVGLSCSVWSAFFLCVFVIAWLLTKAMVPELCQAAEKYVCTQASTTCFYWKPRYWGKCLEFPRSSGFGESERKGRKSYPFSCRSPLKPLGCQEMHSNSIWNTNEIKGSSSPAGERTDQWMPLCTEGARERRLWENERAVSGPCGNRRTEIKRESHWFRDGKCSEWHTN